MNCLGASIRILMIDKLDIGIKNEKK